MAANCASCYNAKLKVAGLDLSSAEGFARGGQSGPAISKLLQVTGYGESMKMPPGGKLKDDGLADLRTWAQAGASWPGAVVTTETGKKFWAFQPRRKPSVPATKDRASIKTPVDSFILAKWEENGLKPAKPADKLTLLRRVTFDLTGLPPAEEEIKSLLADRSPKAGDMANSGDTTGWTSRATPIPPATTKTIATHSHGATATR